MAVQRVIRRGVGALAVAGAALVVGGVIVPVPAGAADPSADLSVTVSHDPPKAMTGDDITFTITVRNDGPDAATGVVVGLGYQYPLEVDTLPAGCRRSPSYQSITCTVADLPSGDTAVIDLVALARGSGLFQVPVAVASDVVDPDADDLVDQDIVLVEAGPTQGERVVAALYPIILDRPADPASLAYWAARWDVARYQIADRRPAVPAGLIGSNEYRRLRIREAYQRILGRAADAPSLEYWTRKAAAGWSFETIEQYLLGSREFLSKRERPAQIADSFQAILRRPASPGDVSDWQRRLASGRTLREFHRTLQQSTEGFDVTIARIYQDTFGHGPSSLGRYGAQVDLRNGVSPEALWVRLLVSPTFLADFPLTEDDYANPVPILDGAALTDAVRRAVAAA